jgi:hypothetical protein
MTTILPLGHSIAIGNVNGLSAVRGGYCSTSSTTITAIRATVYTEPTSAQQMRLVSSNANDSSAGTGSRTIEITYYDGSLNGPFTEIVTMNGTTPVNTVATNIRFIEKLRTLTIGSNGTNVGTISIQNIGGGTTFGSIAISDGVTYWTHHYVPSGKKCFITRIQSGCQGNSGVIFPRYISVLTANAHEEQIIASARTTTAQPSQIYDWDNFYVTGPGRICLYFRSDSATANTIHANLCFYEV